MKTRIGRPLVAAAAVAAILFGSAVCLAGVAPGQTAPVFVLKDLGGKAYDLARMKERPMVILYFFDAESRPSQEGLLNLDRLAKKQKGSNLAVWAVSASPRAKVAAFASGSGLGFPVLLDGSGVGDLYGAGVILPTVCVIGPRLKVLDQYQGGGPSGEAMLVRVAERTLQGRQTRLAKALGDDVAKKNPKNVSARAVKGYAALKEGNLTEAEEVFTQIARAGGKGEVVGKEGLAAVYARKDQPDKALALAGEVERKAPDRAYVHVIKGDILYARNRRKEAEEEYRLATTKKGVEPYQEAVRFNQLGRLYASSGQYKKARDLYDRATSIDPYYIEGTTNKGLTYEKEGSWDKAMDSYRQALTLDKNDSFAAVLAKKAQEMLDLQKDEGRRKRVDQLVKDLAARYRSQKESQRPAEDTWTTGPMVLTFVDFQEKGGLAERDGFSAVLMAQLSDRLNGSGRVKVVERALMDRLLEELNLGSSELANQETALKLGKVLAARLIGTGSFLHTPQGTLLSMRLIDTETSGIPQVTTRPLSSQGALDKDLFQLNREILATVIGKYPLRGFVVKAAGDEAMLNLGANQGVVAGTAFDVLDEAESITYKGKTLKGSPKTAARLEVTRVEPDLCHVKVVSRERPLKTDDKVQERIAETAAK